MKTEHEEAVRMAIHGAMRILVIGEFPESLLESSRRFLDELEEFLPVGDRGEDPILLNLPYRTKAANPEEQQ